MMLKIVMVMGVVDMVFKTDTLSPNMTIQVPLRVLREKHDKNGHLLRFVPHTYFRLSNPFTNICT